MSDTRAEGPAADERVDVVQYPSGAVKAVPAGKGRAIARSQRRRRPGSLLGDRTVLVAGGLAALVAGGLSVLVLAYSVLLLRNLLLGFLSVVLLWGAAGVLVLGVTAVRWLQLGDAGLLEEDVTVRDAREQWEATPVAAVAEDPGVGEHRPEHAVEGEAGSGEAG